MRYRVEHLSGEGWDRIRLHDTATGCKADVVPSAGGILNAFSIPTPTGEHDFIDGFTDAADFRSRIEKGFQSAKLSPYVCRIKDAAYRWQDRSYRIGRFLLNGAAIHGLLYDRPFETVEEAVHADHAEVALKHVYPGSDPGYPFAYDCYIRYRLEEDGCLLVTTAVHNRSHAPIPVADGWHPYFTLGAKVDGLLLQVKASVRLEYDEGLIPTGKTLPDTSWMETRPIGDTRLDHGYVLDFDRDQPLCTLSNPATGLSLSILPEKSYPYLQLYTPDHRDSIAIENLSAAPDAFNNGIGLTVLDPDHTKTFATRYRIGRI